MVDIPATRRKNSTAHMPADMDALPSTEVLPNPNPLLSWPEVEHLPTPDDDVIVLSPANHNPPGPSPTAAQQTTANTSTTAQTAQHAGPAGPSSSAGQPKLDAAGITSKCSDLLREMHSLLLPGAGQGSQLVGPELAGLWKSELEKLVHRCQLPETVVGVVGATGAGKSSMLNALLGEEDVLPTNGMRACTASVVEVGYAPGSQYTAEVEFITREEWNAQLEEMWSDLKDEEGNIRVFTGTDRRVDTRTDWGAAQANIESVLGKTILRGNNVTLDQLKNARSNATRHLGTTVRVRELTAKAFRKEIGGYVDSNNRSDTPQTWPLVKIVRIKHSWQVLSGGVLLVDLPGTRDANAARGAIADRYLKKCNAVFVVADITRAVDDKTAKDLLGKEFRRQMLMDGQYGSISFICTKTDNVDVSSTIHGLGVDQVAQLAGVKVDELQELDDRLDYLRGQETTRLKEQKQHKSQIKKLHNRHEKLNLELQHIENLLAQRAGGSEQNLPWDVLAVIEDNRAKRPRLDILLRSKDDSDSDEEDGEDDEEEEEEEEAEWQQSDSDSEGARKRKRKDKKKGPKLTNKVQRELKDLGVDALQEQHTSRTNEMFAIKDQVGVVQEVKFNVEAELRKVQGELAKKQQQMNGICALARNAYSRGRLKEDFRSGLVDMADNAHDAVMEDRIASLDLPVFCVSARDCQKLEGRCRKDGRPHAFSNKEHTDVPALRSHVLSIGDQGRAFVVRHLVGGMASFISSTAATLLNVSSVSASFVPSITAAFQHHKSIMAKKMAQQAADFVAELKRMLLDEGLLPRLANGSSTAAVQAVNTAASWNRLYWSTYKATTRRHGSYVSGSAGELNFNSDLARPILDAISVAWEGLFGSKAGERLGSLQKELMSLLDAQLGILARELTEIGVDGGTLNGIKTQALKREQQRMKDSMAAVQGLMHERQKDLSRDVLVPTIKAEMTLAFDLCSAERGSGSYMRMKEHMRGHVTARAPVMFQQATRELRDEVVELVTAVKAQLEGLQRDLSQSIQTRFSTLWEIVPCNAEDRYAALKRLHEVGSVLVPLCGPVGVPAMELFDLPDPPEPGPDPSRYGNAGMAEGEDEEGEEEEGEEESEDEGEEDGENRDPNDNMETDRQPGLSHWAAKMEEATRRRVAGRGIMSPAASQLRSLLRVLSPEQQLAFAQHAASMTPAEHAVLASKPVTVADVKIFVDGIGCLSAEQWVQAWYCVARMGAQERDAFAAEVAASFPAEPAPQDAMDCLPAPPPMLAIKPERY